MNKEMMREILMEQIERVSYPYSNRCTKSEEQLALVYCCQNMAFECFYEGVLNCSEYNVIDGLLYQVSLLLEDVLYYKENPNEDKMYNKYHIDHWNFY